MRQAAWICFGPTRELVPCIVWDLSERGARVAAAHSSTFPNLFALIFSRGDTSHQLCRVVWRAQGHLGVEFVEAEQAERVSRAMDGPPNPGLAPYRKL